MASATILASSKNKDCWNSSVHCSYYSLLQMMIHLLANVRQPSLPLDKLLDKSKGDTHSRIKEAVMMEIKTRNEMARFADGFEFLRRMRVAADYKPELFSQEKCLDIKEKSESLRNKAKSYFRK